MKCWCKLKSHLKFLGHRWHCHIYWSISKPEASDRQAHNESGNYPALWAPARSMRQTTGVYTRVTGLSVWNSTLCCSPPTRRNARHLRQEQCYGRAIGLILVVQFLSEWSRLCKTRNLSIWMFFISGKVRRWSFERRTVWRMEAFGKVPLDICPSKLVFNI